MHDNNLIVVHFNYKLKRRIVRVVLIENYIRNQITQCKLLDMQFFTIFVSR